MKKLGNKQTNIIRAVSFFVCFNYIILKIIVKQAVLIMLNDLLKNKKVENKISRRG